MLARFYKLIDFILIMGEILLKIHKSYRWVVAVCDKDVFGRKLVDEKRVLDVSGEFFNGKEMSEEEVAGEIVRCSNEDATFNFVGENSVRIAKELGIVNNKGIVMIEGVPFALALV